MCRALELGAEQESSRSPVFKSLNDIVPAVILFAWIYRPFGKRLTKQRIASTIRNMLLGPFQICFPAPPNFDTAVSVSAPAPAASDYYRKVGFGPLICVLPSSGHMTRIADNKSPSCKCPNSSPRSMNRGLIEALADCRRT